MRNGRPLLGFSVETEGSEAGDILIVVGDSSDLMIHHVDRPRSKWVAELMPGAKVDKIEDEEGIITLVLAPSLRCRPRTLPPLWRPLEDHRRHRSSPMIAKILTHLGLPARAPPQSPAIGFQCLSRPPFGPSPRR